MFPKDAESGLMCLPEHQPHHLDQAELYAEWVLDLQDWRSSSVTLSEKPCDEKPCLRQTTRLKTSDSPVLGGEDSKLDSGADPAPWGEGPGSPPTSSTPTSTTPGLAKLELSDKQNLPLLCGSS